MQTTCQPLLQSKEETVSLGGQWYLPIHLGLIFLCRIVQMVGRGEEVEGEGLTLAQFMGTYYR